MYNKFKTKNMVYHIWFFYKIVDPLTKNFAVFLEHRICRFRSVIRSQEGRRLSRILF